MLIICPVWPAQAWYPHLLQLLTDNPVLLVRPTGKQTSNDRQQLPASSRMETLREHLSSEGISKEATDILLSAQRGSTNAQYKSCWAKWCGWSRQRQIDPFCPAVSDLVHFLTELFEQGKQYSTINTYRSAISSTVPPLDGTPLGQHKIVCSFMRGVFNRRPPKPRYSLPNGFAAISSRATKLLKFIMLSQTNFL